MSDRRSSWVKLFDLKQAYHQFPLARAVQRFHVLSRRLSGKWSLTRLPMGMRQSAAIAQTMVCLILHMAVERSGRLGKVSGVVFIDNLAIFGSKADVNAVASEFLTLCETFKVTIGDSAEGQGGNFIGVEFELNARRYRIGEKSRNKFDTLRNLIGATYTTPRQILALTGFLSYAQYVSAADFRLAEAFILWRTQQELSYLPPARLDDVIEIRSDVSAAVARVFELVAVGKWFDMVPPTVDAVAVSDACSTGWAVAIWRRIDNSITIARGKFPAELQHSTISEPYAIAEAAKLREVQIALAPCKHVEWNVDHSGLLKSLSWGFSYVGSYNVASRAIQHYLPQSLKLSAHFVEGTANPVDLPSRGMLPNEAAIIRWFEGRGRVLGFPVRFPTIRDSVIVD
jgi:hypothetical protein